LKYKSAFAAGAFMMRMNDRHTACPVSPSRRRMLPPTNHHHSYVEAAFGLMLILCLVHARRVYREHHISRNLEVWVCSLVYSLLVEYVVYVLMEKFQPRTYDHETTFLQMQGIPVYILALWSTVLYVSHHAALSKYSYGGVSSWAQVLQACCTAALLAVALDSVLEPCAMAQFHWVYKFDLKEDTMLSLGTTWNGAPLTNLAAWAPMQFAFSFCMLAFPSSEPKNKSYLILRVMGGVMMCFFLFAVMDLARKRGRVSDVNFLLGVCGMGFVGFVTTIRQARKQASTDYLLATMPALWFAYSLASITWQPENTKLTMTKNQVVELSLCSAFAMVMFASLVCAA
jgi:hypothetical protein